MFLTTGSRAQRKRGGGAVTAPLALNFGTITSNPGEPTPGMGLSIYGTWNAGGVTFDAPLFMNVTNTASANGSRLVDFQAGGTSLFGLAAAVSLSGKGVFPLVQIGSSVGIGGPTTFLFFNGNGTLEFWAGVNSFLFGNSNNSNAIVLTNPAASTIAFVNSTTATALQVYNTIDSNQTPVNYERGVFDWTTTTNTLTVGPQAGGTGTLRDMALLAATKNIWLFNSANAKVGTASGAVWQQHHDSYGAI